MEGLPPVRRSLSTSVENKPAGMGSHAPIYHGALFSI
uniref:Uncharacterized protein n=1 Tax=Utricularia reniformis TaxID=192314 RepID=A0A1Y0AZP1_9LAMI|nr:hypothetical protein AEK19_MT0373 [Utricularia reniformis]ART30645.1 hypothetical protein AEK19_MT0373 [Utricularia reniformis]